MSARMSERIDGPGETVVDIALPWALFRLGEVIRGHVNLTAVERRASSDLTVRWECEGMLTVRIQGPIILLAKRLRLRLGVSVAVPFELPLPPSAPVTSTTVDASSAWFVVARLNYTSSPTAERAQYPIAVLAGNQ